MKGCKELVQEGMQVLEGTLSEMAMVVVGILLWGLIPSLAQAL